MARPRNVGGHTDKKRDDKELSSLKKDITYERADIGGFTLLFQVGQFSRIDNEIKASRILNSHL
jgi:hypothetical protein